MLWKDTTMKTKNGRYSVNAAAAMAEADCTDRQIMAVLGHKTYRVAQQYIARANQKKLSDQAIGKWERASGKLKNIKAICLWQTS